MSKNVFIGVDVVYTHINGNYFIFIIKLASLINDIIHRSFVFVRKTQEEVE